MSKRAKTINLVFTAFMALICIFWLYPFILVVLNSFKSNSEMLSNVVGLPKVFRIQNYVHTWESMNFPRLYLNNIIYTVGGVAGIVFFGALAAFKLSRTNTRFSKVAFLIFILPMMIPFQTIMITFTKVAAYLGLTGNLFGVIIFQWGGGIPMALFLYHGFIKTIPIELDESAAIDGAGAFRVFFQIIMPLLKPVTTTIVVICALGIWNDFMLVLLLIGAKAAFMNIPLAISNSFGTYYANWETALPGMMLGIIPAIVFFLFLQKYIINGLTAGALKG
jgi:raffinose/stachyose/melibiose transport system permease protein